MKRPASLVFDLFGTLVFFDDSRLPVEEVGGRRIPQTIPGLDGRLEELRPGLGKLEFLRAVHRAGKELHQEKLALGIEVTSDVRFGKALVSLGFEDPVASEVSHRFADAHMDTLARAVTCPPGRPELLRRLSENYRLALLSNFDHAATARRVIDEAGLTGFFEVIVVSAEEGLRKPSPEICARCCRRMELEPGDCLFIGDTWSDDIEGATSAGIPAVWVRPGPKPENAAPAAGVVADVEELPGWLDGAGVSGPGGASR